MAREQLHSEQNAVSSAGTILLSHCTEHSILLAPDSQDIFPAFSVGKRKRQATCSDVAWIGETHLAAVNLYGGHLRIYRLHEHAGKPLRLELIHETPGLAAPEGVAVSPDATLLAVSHSLSEDNGLSLFPLDGHTLAPGPADLLCRGRPGSAFHGVNFSSDGRYLGYTVIGPESSIEIIRVNGREVTCRIETACAPLLPKSIVFSADGLFVLVTYGLAAVPKDSYNPHGGMLAVYHFDAEAGRIAAEPIASYRAPPQELDFIDMSTFLPETYDGLYRILIADQGADLVPAFSFDPRCASLVPDGIFAEGLSFPHGIAAAADGRYVAVSTYGDDRIHIASGGRAARATRPPLAAVKKRVAIIGHMAESAPTGAERSFLDILAAIDRDQFHATCFLPNDNAAYRALVQANVDEIVTFPYQWRSVVPCDPRDVGRFEAEFRRNRIDLVHVNTVTLLAPLLAAARVGIPSILHARELIDQDEQLAQSLGGPPGKIEHTLKAQADFVIANSDATHRLFRKQGRSRRIYNCVDLDHFDRPNEPVSAKLKIGIIGTVSFRKGVDDFVALALLAGQRRPDLEFYMIGARNAELDNIEKRFCNPSEAANLHVADYFADPADAIGLVNVVVSLSIIPESFGRTIAEGMAMRRPIVSYDRGAAPELVRHELDGFLVPHRDVGAAFQALQTLADSPERVLEMGRNARARAEVLFSSKIFARELNRFYRDALGGIGKPRSLASADECSIGVAV